MHEMDVRDERAQILVNGAIRRLSPGTTIDSLLADFKLEPLRVAVEVNERLVRRADFSATTLVAGDRVEIVTLVGGG